MTNEQRKYLKEFSRCELCGSPKSLELHHIIPTSFGGPDVVDNWIAICHGCHAKLTPKSILVKKGQTKYFNPVHDFYKLLQQGLQEAMDNGEVFRPDADYVLDCFEEIFQNNQYPVKATYEAQRYKVC